MAEIKSFTSLEDRLLVYHNIRENELFKTFIDLLNQLTEGENEEYIISNYYKFCSKMIEYGEKINGDEKRNPWQNFILNYIINDENIFTHQVENNKYKDLGESLKGAVKNDLSILEKFYRFDQNELKNEIKNYIDSKEINLPSWNQITANRENWNYNKEKFFQELDNTAGWKDKIKELSVFYQKNGTGKLNSYKAFKWNKGLKGIVDMDSITFDGIIGYENQIEKIRHNTKKLLSGNRANNILLYGDKGTGKSSTVKALVNEYWPRGLRLIEFKKNDFNRFNEIVDRLNSSNLYFILFIDDLSFSEEESGYRDLKATLEGRTKLLPENVVIYATSNRRHLVKENFSGGENKLRKQDTVQEKLSLADRFGITIIYTTPTQKEYLKIVKKLAQQRNLPVETEKLEDRAKRWEKKQNGRSGRTARQFIDYIEGELNMGNKIL